MSILFFPDKLLTGRAGVATPRRDNTKIAKRRITFNPDDFNGFEFEGDDDDGKSENDLPVYDPEGKVDRKGYEINVIFLY